MPLDKWARREYMREYRKTHPAQRRDDLCSVTGTWGFTKVSVSPEEHKRRMELAKALTEWMERNGKTFEDLGLGRAFESDVRFNPDRLGKTRQDIIRKIIGDAAPRKRPPKAWTGPSDADVRHCRMCVYWDQTNSCCDYALIEHHSRGCRGDVNCKQFKKGDHERQWARLALSP